MVNEPARWEICSAFGDIHDIIAMKSLSRKGQAWVVFKEKQAAREALTSLQNFPLFDKPMKLSFAKARSTK